MKKGCFGCFGGGCFLILIIISITTYLGYSFMQTTGRETLANEIEVVIKTLINRGITSEEIKTDAYLVTENFISKIKNNELGLLEVLSNVDKVFGKEYYVKSGLIGIYKQIDENNFQASDEQKQSLEKLITAVYQKNLQTDKLASFTMLFKTSEWQAKKEPMNKPSHAEEPEQSASDTQQVFLGYENLITKELSKESFMNALEAITKFSKENALEEIEENFDTDKYISFDIKNIIFRLSNPDLVRDE